MPAVSAFPNDATGGLASWQRRKLDRYIERHLDDALRLTDLARELGLSPSHFARAFRQSTGTTPHAHVVALRLRHARELMLCSDQSLGQIAVGCGFTDQAHLTRLFRLRFGEPPGAWRRRRTEPTPGPQKLTAHHAS
jgi:transcriptional regulator GlxA family with amidase domain